MRTVLTRLAAIGALAALAGCSGGSTNAFQVGGPSNGSGGANGLVTGNSTGLPPQPAAAVTTVPVVAATGLAAPVTIAGVGGISSTLIFGASNAPAGTTLVITSNTGFGNAAFIAGAIQFFTITANNTITFSTAPVLTVNFPNTVSSAGRTLRLYNPTTGTYSTIATGVITPSTTVPGTATGAFTLPLTLSGNTTVTYALV